MYFTTLLILMLMQAPEPGAAFNSGIKVIQIEGGQGVVLPATVPTPWDSKTGAGRWNPTEAQARDAEACLKSFLRKSKSSDQQWILQHLRRYKRQYAGISRDGKQQILLNFFMLEHEPDWTGQFIQIEDGGRTVFQIFYDPAKKTCFDFSMNGVA